MTMQTKKILQYCFSIVFCFCINFCNAQIDTSTNKNIISKDSIAKKHFKLTIPKHYYIGLDIAKLFYNTIDPNKKRLEIAIDAPLQKSNWLTLNLGFASGKLKNDFIDYNSTSVGGSIGVNKSLFTPMHSKDVDNAFIGLAYGFAYNKTSEVNYTIKDIWGTSNGLIASKNIPTHWIELNAGFRFEITKNILLGWRIQGKTLLNQKVINSIAPIYIAPYGNGDRVSTFGYNFLVQYKLF
jgi:hypothetical protein